MWHEADTCHHSVCDLYPSSVLCGHYIQIYGHNYPGYEPVSRGANCSQIIQKTLSILSRANLSISCSLLSQPSTCQAKYDQATTRADPFNVFLRSSLWDLEMPKFSVLNNFEKKFPLAYFITAFKYPRNLELMLKTIFRPPNAYCIHVDQKADELFHRTVSQILHCFKQVYPETFIFRSSKSILGRMELIWYQPLNFNLFKYYAQGGTVAL